MAKTFAEFARERRDRMGSEGREAERVFRAHYTSLADEGLGPARSRATPSLKIEFAIEDSHSSGSLLGHRGILPP